MTITIPDDLTLCCSRTRCSRGISVDEYLARLIRYAGSTPVEDTAGTDEEQAEIDAALEEGIAEIEQGKAFPGKSS